VGGPPAWGLGGGLTTLPRKTQYSLRITIHHLGKGLITWQDLKHWKMDTRFGTWNVRSPYRSGSLKTVARDLGKHKLDLVGVQEVRWIKGSTEQA
jgi:hypothetical protein